MAHVWTTAYEARLISLRCEKSEREGVAANERDGARNGDGQMFAVSLKSREGCPVGALPRPRLWNALTHFRVQKKREPDRQTDRRLVRKHRRRLKIVFCLSQLCSISDSKCCAMLLYGPFFLLHFIPLPPPSTIALNLSYSIVKATLKEKTFRVCFVVAFFSLLLFFLDFQSSFLTHQHKHIDAWLLLPQAHAIKVASRTVFCHSHEMCPVWQRNPPGFLYNISSSLLD